MPTRGLMVAAIVASLSLTACGEGAEPEAGGYRVGVAKIDITPNYPVRLSGFGGRRQESEGVAQHIWAKALVIDDGNPALLLTVDNVGIPAWLVAELKQRLQKKAGLDPERIAVTATHTHTAPMLKGMLATLFGVPIPPEHQEHIDRYTKELLDNLEAVALAAMGNRQPANLSWGIGRLGFATNRRTKGGPVDLDMPMLVVRDGNRKIRAIYVNYACHCVTLSFNKISGDWAGFAQELIQQENPGAIALVSVGCGADSNPSSGVTGDKIEVAARQGGEVAAEVKRMLGGFLAPIHGPIRITSGAVELPLAQHPTEAEWEKRGQRTDAIGYHAPRSARSFEAGAKTGHRDSLPGANVEVWRFAGHGVPAGRGCRGLCTAPQTRARWAAALAQRLFERFPGLHPFRTHLEGRRLRGGRRHGLLRCADAVSARARGQDRWVSRRTVTPRFRFTIPSNWHAWLPPSVAAASGRGAQDAPGAGR